MFEILLSDFDSNTIKRTWVLEVQSDDVHEGREHITWRVLVVSVAVSAL